MFRFLPQKVIAFFIMLVGFTEIFFDKYKNIICLFFVCLSLFLMFQCLHYKNLSDEFEREVRSLDSYASELEEKISMYDSNKIPEGFEVEVEPQKKRISINTNSIGFDSNRSSRTEYYTQYKEENRRPIVVYETQKSPDQNIDQELLERRIMYAESKANNSEWLEDARIFGLF